jgi:hypothetical protein
MNRGHRLDITRRLVPTERLPVPGSRAAEGQLKYHPSAYCSSRFSGAPHIGFSRLILRISSRVSLETFGLPGFPCRAFQVQKSRKPFRCQATTVSGFTITRTERQSRQKRSYHPERLTKGLTKEAQLSCSQTIRLFRESQGYFTAVLTIEAARL